MALGIRIHEVSAILTQLPGSININEGFDKLKALAIDERYRHALKVKHVLWFDDAVYNNLQQNNICLVWSQRNEIATPPIVTSDFIYLQIIGDRGIAESEIGTIRKDRLKEI